MKFEWKLNKDRDIPDHPLYENLNTLYLDDREIGYIKRSIENENIWIFVYDSEDFVLKSEHKPIGWVYQRCEEIARGWL